MIGRWLISKNKISVNAVAICEKENLLECTANSWKVQSTTDGNNGIDGLILMEIDESMTLSNNECLSDQGNANKEEGFMSKNFIIIIVIVCAVVVIILGYFMWSRSNKLEKEVLQESLLQKSYVPPNKNDIEVEVSMQKEIEFEVSMQK